MNLICGINPVIEALSAGTRHFERLLIVKGIRNRRVSEAIARASQMGVPLRFEGRETLDRMAGGVPHQGVIAVVSAKPVMGLDSLLDEARHPPLVLVLDGVEDPRNLGAILRTAEAAGADGVLLPERHSAGLSETVGRASAGALEHVRVARIGNVVQALEALKTRGFWVVGFDAAGTQRWDAVDYRRPIAIVLGGEGRGIRRLVRERCDHLVSLPLFGHVASLNVSVAGGIALYEVIRQRGSVPSHVRPIPLRPAPSKQVVGPGPEDEEHDPGALAPASTSAVDPEGAADAEPGEEEAPLSLVRIHEETAWSGPLMVAPSGYRRQPAASRPPGREPSQAPDTRPVPGVEARGDENSPPVEVPANRGTGRARRRRRRRGGRGGGEPGGDRVSPAAGEPTQGPAPRPEGSPGSRRRR